jgi:arabinosaccharide transport system permease protein
MLWARQIAAFWLDGRKSGPMFTVMSDGRGGYFPLWPGCKIFPQNCKEAAVVDGATRWQVFRFITLPMLRPVLAFVLTFAIIGSYNLFAEPVTLVGEVGGPNNAGLTMTMYLYNRGFRELRMSYAAAIGYTLAIIIVILTIIQLILIRAFRED